MDFALGVKITDPRQFAKVQDYTRSRRPVFFFHESIARELYDEGFAPWCPIPRSLNGVICIGDIDG